MSVGEKMEVRRVAERLREVFGRKKSGGRNERVAMQCARALEAIIGCGEVAR